uniref:Uncharacterized protein n=1 Tax=Arundo donax TaxID=35708 RepID=A0A0A9EBL9_ARUDO
MTKHGENYHSTEVNNRCRKLNNNN